MAPRLAYPRKIGLRRKNAQFRGTRKKGSTPYLPYVSRSRPCFWRRPAPTCDYPTSDNPRDPRIAHVFNRLSAKNLAHGLSLRARARARTWKPVSRATYDVGDGKCCFAVARSFPNAACPPILYADKRRDTLRRASPYFSEAAGRGSVRRGCAENIPADEAAEGLGASLDG